MNTNDDRNDNSTKDNTGFIWSARLSVAAGFALALVLAVAKFAPALAAPIEWIGH